MKKKIIIIVAMLVAISTLFSVPASAWYDWIWLETYNSSPKSYAYSFAFVGDTQTLSTLDADTTTLDPPMAESWGYDTTGHIGKGYMGMIYDWILDNQEEKKIAHVFGLGDITQSRNLANGGKSARDEWEAAKAAWSRMDGKISYSMTRGNHDNAALYMEYLNYDAYLSQFDGYFSSGKNVGRSTYKFLDAGQEKWLLVSLDFGARDDVLKWAGEIIEANPDRKVLITTHGYLYDGSRRTGGSDYISASDEGYNLGDDIWDKLVRKYENILMVVCGHSSADPLAFRRSTGDNGNTVYEIMVNPQGYDAEKEPVGMVLMMYFSEDGSTFYLEHYSTIKKQYTKLPYTRVKFSEPRFTTAPETTAAEPDVTVETDGEISENNGCGAVAIIPALPVILGTAAFVGRKKKEDND